MTGMSMVFSGQMKHSALLSVEYQARRPLGYKLSLPLKLHIYLGRIRTNNDYDVWHRIAQRHLYWLATVTALCWSAGTLSSRPFSFCWKRVRDEVIWYGALLLPLCENKRPPFVGLRWMPNPLMVITITWATLNMRFHVRLPWQRNGGNCTRLVICLCTVTGSRARSWQRSVMSAQWLGSWNVITC